MVGCTWWAVYGGPWMVGRAWRAVHGGPCMVGGAWWAEHTKRLTQVHRVNLFACYILGVIEFHSKFRNIIHCQFKTL
jgi:hypothetical protein